MLEHLEDSLQHASQYPSSMYLETVQMLYGRKGGCAYIYYKYVNIFIHIYIYLSWHMSQ